MTEYKPQAGDYVKLGAIYTGVIEDVFWNDDGDYVIQVALVKNAFQRGASELHSSKDELLEIIPATADDIRRDIQRYSAELGQRLEKFNMAVDSNLSEKTYCQCGAEIENPICVLCFREMKWRY